MAALSIGAHGSKVTSLQKRLLDLGYARVTPDGVFGKVTLSAVADLQDRHGLDVTGQVDARLTALLASKYVVAPPRKAPKAIGKREIGGQMPYLTAAFKAPSRAARRSAVAEGFMMFGARYVFLMDRMLTYARDAMADPTTDAAEVAGITQTQDAISDLEHVGEWFRDWLAGERFTDRADEADWRALVAKRVLDELGLARWTRIAVKGVLALPEGHAQRDLDWARSKLREHLMRCRLVGDDHTALLTIQDIVGHELLPPQDAARLLKEGERVVPRIDDASARRNFWVSVMGFHMVQAFQERDRLNARSQWLKVDGEPDVPPSRRRLKRSRALAEAAMSRIETLLDEIPEADRSRVGAKNRLSLAMLYGLDQPAKSADLLKEAERGGTDPTVRARGHQLAVPLRRGTRSDSRVGRTPARAAFGQRVRSRTLA